MVAIVGRKNVGKSTLFNRLSGRRISIVEDLPGTTRDRIKTEIEAPGGRFELIDMGGLETSPESTVEEQINLQIDNAILEADLVLFTVDIKNGINPADYDIASKLRRAEKQVLMVANKADNTGLEYSSPELSALGFGNILPISAYHGRGISELLDAISASLPRIPELPARNMPAIRIALVGRPNVGKSMLLNGLLGESRVVVSSLPGTTRDPVDTYLDFNGQDMILIDTAGIKKRGRQGQGIERYSVDRSHESIERADIALLVLDATEMITEQDLHIAGFIHQALKGIVIIVNKWDLTDGLGTTEVRKFLRSRLKFFQHAPVVFTSALTRSGLDQILPRVVEVFKERVKRISTSQLNSLVQQVTARHSPPRKQGRALKFLYATQAEVNPPTFVFFVNDRTLMHFSYQRYIENQLRSVHGFAGTPINLVFKTRSGT